MAWGGCGGVWLSPNFTPSSSTRPLFLLSQSLEYRGFMILLFPAIPVNLAMMWPLYGIALDTLLHAL